MNINPMDMFKDLSAFKEKLNQADKELKEMSAMGQSGGGLVKVTLNGRYECLSVELDPIAVDNRDVATLQTLIKSAHHDAVNKINEKMKTTADGFGSHLSAIISNLG